MKRLFIAIKIVPNQEFLYQYEVIMLCLKANKMNWIQPDHFHLTLKFLGLIADDKIDEIEQELKQVHFKPFVISIEKLGIFGSRYKPRVLWTKVQDNGEMRILAEEIIERMHRIGLKRDRQNFVPHLTLARIKNIPDNMYFQQKLQSVKGTFFQEYRVDGFHLYQSILSPKGVKYRSLSYFPFTQSK